MTQTTKVWAMYDGRNLAKAPIFAADGGWHEVEDCNNGECFRAYGGIYRWKGHDIWQRHVGPTPPDAQGADMTTAKEANDRQMCAYCEKRETVGELMGRPCCMVCASLWHSGNREDLLAKAQTLDLKTSCKLTDAELAELKAANAPPVIPNRLPPFIRAAPDADGWITHDGSTKRPKGVGKRDILHAQVTDADGVHGAVFVAKNLNWRHVTSYRITNRAEKRRKVWLQGGDGMVLSVCENKTHAFEQKAKWGGKVYTAKLTEVTE